MQKHPANKTTPLGPLILSRLNHPCLGVGPLGLPGRVIDVVGWRESERGAALRGLR